MRTHLTPSVAIPALLLTLLSLFGAGLSAQAAGRPLAAIEPMNLKCELLENPLGIDARLPRLSWELRSKNRQARGQSQTAWQILAASALERLRQNQIDLWDSGRVPSSQSAHISYAGKTLVSGQQCFWKVRLWDQDGQPSGYSPIASFETGLFEPADWKAQWIARTTDLEQRPAPMLRRQFQLEGKILSARIYVCGLGYYDLFVNGERVGDQVLDPGYTRYDKRCLYMTHDVTRNLKPGSNAMGVTLGHGWFNVQTRAVWDFHKAPWRAAPKLLLALKIRYTDGRTVTIGTDEQWKSATGPIVFNSIYGGETYDARLERPNWSLPAYNDSGWDKVQLVEGPPGALAAQTMVPIKCFETLRPVRLQEPKPGMFIFDFGQNLAGIAELKVRGPAGAKVVLRYGERLAKDGTLDTRDIEQHIKKVDPSQQFQTDTYILNGTGTESWHARFVYHGFQYVEMTGFPGKPGMDALKAIFVHSAVPVTGRFDCSNVMLNKVWAASRWSFLSNLQGVPTDCPHREKNGWTGDAHLAAEQAIFNFDPSTVYAKWIQDLADEQQPSGELPGIVPTSGWGYKWGNGPAWDSAFLLIPFYVYQYYGDSLLLCRHYDGLRRYVDYLSGKAKNGIVSIGLNDWAPFKTQTPADITSTAYYYQDAKIVALAATLLGKQSDAAKYSALAEEIKKAFNAKFYVPETGTYGNGSQTALSCALYQGLVDPENKPRVLEQLVKAVDKTQGHIDTGILGAKYLLNALLENDRADVAYRIVNQRDLPSWGWWLEQGATTLWEQWNGTESRNHIMFGDVVAWFYKALAGIQPDPQSPGFKHFYIKPHVPPGMTSAAAEYHSIRGPIASRWRLDKAELRLDLSVPPNTSATVSLPIARSDQVRESGRPVSRADHVQFLRHEGQRTILKIDSGEYRFSGPLAR